MLSLQTIVRRIADLLTDPSETLDVEIKGWLDLDNQDHKAVLAKALIALANHGGGFVIIGFEQGENGMRAAEGRPVTLAGYTSDTVNAVVTRYAEPPFHCDVELVTETATGLPYPIITVPGGHTTPIKSKRSGPNGQTVIANTYYIRRPGPRNEAPQSGQEWDAMIRRCVTNAREGLIGSFRMLLAGGVSERTSEVDDGALANWFDEGIKRWRSLARGLPPDHPARLQHGYYAAAYRLVGDLPKATPGQVLDLMRQAVVRHTGWPPFQIRGQNADVPYAIEGTIECW